MEMDDRYHAPQETRVAEGGDGQGKWITAPFFFFSIPVLSSLDAGCAKQILL